MSTYSNSAREVEMPDGNVVVLHKAPTGGANTTSNIKKFKYDDNGHVTESTAADAEDLNLSGYSTPTTGTTAIGTSDDVQTAIGKLDHQSHIDQTNILYVANKIGKNLLSRSTLTRAMAPWLPIEPIKAGTYVVSANIDTAATNWAVSFRDENDNSVCDCTGVGYSTLKNGVSATFTGTATQIKFWYANGATDVDAENAMVCTPEAWNISHEFEQYALPNYDLTRLESEDRAALAEVVDSGSKNLWDFVNAPYVNKGVTTTISTTSVTVTSNNASIYSRVIMNATLAAGTYVFSVTISNYNATKAVIGLNSDTEGTDAAYGFIDLTNTGNGNYSCTFTITSARTIYIGFVPNNTSAYAPGAFTASNIMICTKAAFCVSQKFVPYRPSYDTIASTYLTKCNTAVVNSGSLDDVSTNTIAYYSNNVSGLPSGVSGYAICETTVFDAKVMVQKLYMIDGVYNAFIRIKQTGTWRAWKQITNT